MRSGDATGSGTALPADESAEPECTSPAVPGRQGLDSAEVELRRQLHGANTFAPLPTKSMLQFIGSAFEDPMLRILVAAAAISMLLGVHSGEYADGIAITVAVLVVVAVGAGNEWRAQRDYTALDQITSRELVKVTRDGTALSIDASEIVVGDLVELGLGDVVPADVHLTGTTGLIVDESQITGEPLSDKSLGDALFAGSRVLDGRGFGVVTAVGDATVFGIIRGEIGGTDRSTPLQERLERFAVWIGRVGSATAVLTFLALVSADLVRGTATAGFNLEFGELLLAHLTIAVTIVVVSVPEGLPLAVTLSLAYTTRRMAAEKALVRELSACETMGSATVVCTDKTGTLTHGRMDVARLVTDGVELPAGSFGELDDRTRAVWSRAVAVNTSADLVDDGIAGSIGSPTEVALLRLLERSGVDYAAIRSRHEVLHRIEFSSARKYMGTTISCSDSDGDITTEVHLKGAPETVVPMCVGVDPCVADLVEAAGSTGHRVLAMAVGPDADSLRLLGLVLLEDTMRDEVPASVRRCRSAGVAVKMVTGDNVRTALEIACRAGITDRTTEALHGPELRELGDDELIERLREVDVVARALPDDKSRIARLLQRDGEVVAMTGDGVNDAPALVCADVGFAMGSGSNVAREAGDVVIADDDFTTIVRAIRWGRSVFENIRKFLMFQLTVNVVALALTFTAALTGFGTPLTAVQLLWVNLIMDSLAAIALTLTPPDDDLYRQAPHGRTDPLVSRYMATNITVTSAYMFTVLWLLLGTDTLFDAGGNEALRNSVVFNVFVLMQVFNAFNARVVRPGRSAWRGLGNSGAFLSVMGVIVAVQILLVSFGAPVFDTVSLGLHEWAVSVALGASVLGVGALGRRMAAPQVPSR